MLSENSALFSEFDKIHALYSLDPDKWQAEFNHKGKPVQNLVREYEDRLCLHSEKGRFAKYSAQLAEKFQNLVKKKYPLIDHIGIRVKTEEFCIPKIDLS